jgi:hypothetical protein
MTKIGLLMIGCVGIATTGCVADEPAADVEQTQVAESEVAVSPGATPNALGQFHLIRLVNTNWCVRPQGGTTADAELELWDCNPGDPAQNWLFSFKASNEYEIINANSGNCWYNDIALPVTNMKRPIVQGGCNIFGTNVPASNALWHPSALTGEVQIMTRIGHRETNFCFDVPNGQPFRGATMWNFQCNGTGAQRWIVGIE